MFDEVSYPEYSPESDEAKSIQKHGKTQNKHARAIQKSGGKKRELNSTEQNARYYEQKSTDRLGSEGQ